jgi:hydrogenase expression/formation protein HypC
MCLGLPGEVVELSERDGVRLGLVEVGGVRKPTCFSWTPEARVGDHVVVHAGFAVAVLDEAAAARSRALFAEMRPESTEGVA